MMPRCQEGLGPLPRRQASISMRLVTQLASAQHTMIVRLGSADGTPDVQGLFPTDSHFHHPGRTELGFTIRTDRNAEIPGFLCAIYPELCFEISELPAAAGAASLVGTFRKGIQNPFDRTETSVFSIGHRKMLCPPRRMVDAVTHFRACACERCTSGSPPAKLLTVAGCCRNSRRRRA
jgi:hypothetical protein